MELAKLERLLSSYFEGETSLIQEQELRSFFSNKDVPSQFEMYRPLFNGLDAAKLETSSREVDISEVFNSTLKSSPAPKRNFWKYGAAASVIAILAVSSYFYNNQGLTAEEEEALAAFKQTKEVMYLFSANLNEGTEALSHFQKFEKGISAMSFINQIDESKNLILK